MENFIGFRLFRSRSYQVQGINYVPRINNIVDDYTIMSYLCPRLSFDCCAKRLSFSLSVGNYDHQVTDKVNSRVSYEYNKDRLFPAAIAASTSTDTKFGRLRSGVAVDPQVSARVLYIQVVFGMPRTGSSPRLIQQSAVCPSCSCPPTVVYTYVSPALLSLPPYVRGLSDANRK